MEQTPIEKAMELFGKIIYDSIWEQLISYEKTYHRNISEKAWDASFNSFQIGYSVDPETTEVTPVFDDTDKQTYLNQNHPL